MDTAKPNPLTRILPSLTDVAFLMPLVLLFLRMDGAQAHARRRRHGLAHPRRASGFCRTVASRARTSFSSPSPGEPWFAWEWLWDVDFGWLHLHAGMAAVVSGQHARCCRSPSPSCFVLCFENCPNVLIGLRCHLHGDGGLHHALAGAAAPVHAALRGDLLRDAEQRARGEPAWLLLLPLLMVLWTNLHGGFFVGIFLIGCYAAGELATWLVERDPEKAQRSAWRAAGRISWPAGFAAVTLVNPYFYRLHDSHVELPDRIVSLTAHQRVSGDRVSRTTWRCGIEPSCCWGSWPPVLELVPPAVCGGLSGGRFGFTSVSSRCATCRSSCSSPPRVAGMLDDLLKHVAGCARWRLGWASVTRL